MSDALEFDLTVRFADFTLSAREAIPGHGITALSGPSGSGKTTLLRALAGLERRAEGRVRFAGEDWTDKPPAARGIGYVFQDARLFPHLSVAKNLEYGARRRGTAADQLAAVIDALDLGPLLGRAPATLSGGETRRVALGRALASGPKVLLMDEPLTGLDRARKSGLMPYVARAVAGFGVPALYVTHSANEIGFLADRVLSIRQGRLAGWTPALPRLIGQVAAVREGAVQVTLGRTSIWVPGQGQIGENWALPLGESYLLSSQAPGVSNAALVLEARLVQFEPNGALCHLDVAGQLLQVPWRAATGATPPNGARIWLSMPETVAHVVRNSHWSAESP